MKEQPILPQEGGHAAMRQALAHCLMLPGAHVDFPFDPEWPVARHTAGRKLFALFLQYRGEPCINLKCDPMKAEFWRNVYADVLPGYHMNKTHWNTVRLCGSVPWEQLRIMIEDSFTLTRKRTRPLQRGEDLV